MYCKIWLLVNIVQNDLLYLSLKGFMTGLTGVWQYCYNHFGFLAKAGSGFDFPKGQIRRNSQTLLGRIWIRIQFFLSVGSDFFYENRRILTRICDPDLTSYFLPDI